MNDIFVTNDAMILHGDRDTTDEEILSQISGDVRIVQPAEAYELALQDTSSETFTQKPGFKNLTRKDIEELSRDAGEKYQEYLLIARMIDPDPALIKKMRVEEKKTWRKIAREYAEVAGPTLTLWDPINNQLMGMALCQVASEYYEEDYFTGIWNNWEE